MKEYSENEALNKAAAYCTQCERCISEVKAKLDTWGITKCQQIRIIEKLIAEKFIDEQRYATAFVNDKLRFNHWGRIKIIAKLKEKKITQELINNALSQIDEEKYCNILCTIINNKRKEIGNTEEYQAKQKILRFATGRGFEMPIILKLLKFDPDEMDF